MPDIMFMEEVSEECRLPVETLRYYRYVGAGGPKGYKIGRRVVYDRADVKSWLAAQKAASSG
jgi:predicted DNA-binding transcriptional regulator AlpA